MKKNLMRKIIALILFLMLTNLAVATISTKTNEFHSVYGLVYIDDVIAASDIKVRLSFISFAYVDFTNETGYYQIDFMGQEGDTGYLSVYYNGIWNVPVDNPYVNIEDEVGYNIDLHIESQPEFETTLIIGRITNLDTEEDIITFEAVNLRAITFFPFSFNPYTSGEEITILHNYLGVVGTKFIFALCGASILSLNLLIQRYP